MAFQNQPKKLQEHPWSLQDATLPTPNPGLSPVPHAHNGLQCFESHGFIPGIFIPGIKHQCQCGHWLSWVLQERRKRRRERRTQTQSYSRGQGHWYHLPWDPGESRLLQCLSHDVTQPSARGSPQTSSQAEGTPVASWEGQGVPRWQQELLVPWNGDLLELHQAQLPGVCHP